MTNLDLDQLSSITGGTAWAPMELPEPLSGKQAGGFPGLGPTIYNPTIRDLLRGPRSPLERLMNRR